MMPKIADFGLSMRLDHTSENKIGKNLGMHPIQPDHYCAPEVIPGCGWDFKADIWNSGVMVNMFFLTQSVFRRQQHPPSP